jgi:mitochondrial-processing peptidase subunit alpha
MTYSPGGPGKGMYSRLYAHILTHFPQIEHCASFHHVYADSSLFGLFASFSPASSGWRGSDRPEHVMSHLVHQLSLLLYSPLPEIELNRAKNQLKSTMMMALESQAVEVEDLGRQVWFNFILLYLSISLTRLSDPRPQPHSLHLRNDEPD